MKLDIEKLKVDESLWPEGAEALIDGCYFTKMLDGTEFKFTQWPGRWRRALRSWSVSDYVESMLFDVIKRPNPADTQSPPPHHHE